MKNSAKQWPLTVLVIDVFAFAALVVLGYSTVSYYMHTGKFRLFVGVPTVVYAVVYVLIRRVAKRRRDEAFEAEAKAGKKGRG